LHLTLERRLRRGEPRDRHPERRARYVVQAAAVEEPHRARFAAMLAADTDLERGPSRAAVVDRAANELADALLVEHLERIVGEDAAIDVRRQKAACVVAGQTEHRLRQ